MTTTTESSSSKSCQVLDSKKLGGSYSTMCHVDARYNVIENGGDGGGDDGAMSLDGEDGGDDGALGLYYSQRTPSSPLFFPSIGLSRSLH